MQNIWLWVAFGVIVATALIIDLAVFHRRPHVLSLREALAWCVVWVSLAAVFSAALSPRTGAETLPYLRQAALSQDAFRLNHKAFLATEFDQTE